MLFDLGVSSHQLDVAERGFSYMQDGPLDMRMNPGKRPFGPYGGQQLFRRKLNEIIGGYGEERWAKRIAKFIVQARAVRPIQTTAELMDIIKRAIPAAARREGPHPAKRTFQAIRIEVNAELTILRDAFTAAVDALKTGGRLCIITFHSLEDRIAKQTLQESARGCVCPRDFPICVCKNKPRVKILGKPVTASPDRTCGESKVAERQAQGGGKGITRDEFVLISREGKYYVSKPQARVGRIRTAGTGRKTPSPPRCGGTTA